MISSLMHAISCGLRTELLIFFIIIEKTLSQRTPTSIKLQLDAYDIVDDVIDTSPQYECEPIGLVEHSLVYPLSVDFNNQPAKGGYLCQRYTALQGKTVVFSSMQCPPDGRLVNFGNEIRPIETKVEPSVEWPADPMLEYTILMVDPDSPSRAQPTMREWQHWLVVNIPGHDVMSGKVLTEYVGASPPNGTGFHRYVFVVYQQPKKNMTFDEPRISKKSDQFRSMFSTKRFADEYKLGDPFAVNFFQSEYENVHQEET